MADLKGVLSFFVEGTVDYMGLTSLKLTGIRMSFVLDLKIIPSPLVQFSSLQQNGIFPSFARVLAAPNQILLLIEEEKEHHARKRDFVINADRIRSESGVL